jgi:hypothetical protein
MVAISPSTPERRGRFLSDTTCSVTRMEKNRAPNPNRSTTATRGAIENDGHPAPRGRKHPWHSVKPHFDSALARTATPSRPARPTPQLARQTHHPAGALNRLSCLPSADEFESSQALCNAR